MNDVSKKEMVTEETWGDYVASMHYSGFLDYIDCTEEFVSVLEEMIQNAKSFEEIQQSISDLVTERKKFIAFANNNLP